MEPIVKSFTLDLMNKCDLYLAFNIFLFSEVDEIN